MIHISFFPFLVNQKLAKLITSNPLDFNSEKNQKMIPVCIQNFSDYSRLKMLVVIGKQMLVVPGDFFSRLKSSGLEFSNSTIDYFLFPVPPEIIDAESSTSTVNIRENYNASLICKATGTPEPEITWKREDGRKIVIKRKKNNGKKGK